MIKPQKASNLFPGCLSLKQKPFRLPVYVSLIVLLKFPAQTDALANDDVPPSSSKPWAPPGLNEYKAELARQNNDYKGNAIAVQIDPNKEYDLPELIDIAESSNPNTRTAWERARQSAAAVGLSQSAYYPYLAASAAAGYERIFFPFPTLKVGPKPTDVSITGGDALAMEAAGGGTTLNMKWLLFDFGERKAMVTEARGKLMAANIGFNAIHQQIVFQVTQSFYAFDTARQQVAAAESALQAAKTVAESAKARYDHGLETKPAVLQAEQQSAQALFDLETAQGQLSDAQVALVESLGVLPTSELHVVAASDKPIPESFGDSLDSLIDRALSQRPDLVAKLADVRVAQAEVKQAKAAYYPKISFEGNVGYSRLVASVDNSSFFGGNQPVYGVGVAVDLPIFEGFARRHKVRMAESGLAAAESELASSRDAAVRDVWKAYTDFKTALRKQDSAKLLLSAAQSAFDASLDSYRHGLGSYVDVVNAQRSLTAAHGVAIDTRSTIFTSQTALALSIGDLDKPTSTTGYQR